MAGVAFIGTVGLLISLTSSISYAYRQAETKKFGKQLNGTVTDKRIEQESIRHDTREAGWTSTTVNVYYIEYSYSFDKEYEGETLLENKDFYEKISVGDTIPLKVLSHKPHVNQVRLAAFGKHYGLSRKESV